MCVMPTAHNFTIAKNETGVETANNCAKGRQTLHFAAIRGIFATLYRVVFVGNGGVEEHRVGLFRVEQT